MHKWLTGFLILATLSFAQDISPELLKRMLGADAAVYVGELPRELPVALTLPEGVSVDAAVARRWPGQTSVQLFLSSSRPLAPTWQALSDSLEAVGLSPFTPTLGVYGWTPWGFVVEGLVIPSDIQVFCGPDAYAELFTPEDETPLQFMLTLSSRGRTPDVVTPCDADAYGAYEPPPTPPVPAMPPPQGVQMLRAEIGGGPPLEQTSSAAFEPGPDLADLHEHYAAQLAAAGWEELRRGGDTLLLYSQWRKEGEPWTLLITFSDEALSPGFVTGVLRASQQLP